MDSIMSEVEREWLSPEEAGRYVGISPNYIREAIARHELTAYVKPVTTKRTATNPANQHTYYKVSKTDIDKWIRDTWEWA